MERVTDPLASTAGGTRRGWSIRTKLLILLLVLSIAPMLIAVLVGQFSTRLVGNRLTAETQRQLEDDAMTRLLQSTRAAARLAGSEVQQINLSVIVQGRAAARAIDQARSGDAQLDEATLYWARADFDDSTKPVPGIETEPDGRRVSSIATSIVLAPGVDPASVRTDIIAMQLMAEPYARLREFNPGLISSQYTATVTGVHSAFPGHGGYPRDYDPRTRPWYVLGMDAAAMNEGSGASMRPLWGDPIVDATTARVIIPVAVPVVDDDGAIAGVTAVDIEIRTLIDHFKTAPSWTQREELLIVSMVGHEEHGSGNPEELAIYAQRSYEDESSDRSRDIALESFRLDDSALSLQMATAVRAGESSVMRGTRGGVDLLCAYAPISASDKTTEGAVILTVPYADVIDLAESIDDEFWGIIVAQLKSNSTIAALVIGLVVIIAFRGSRSITRPIHSLVKTVDSVANGDLNARADVKTGDELELLADDFNSMIPKLRDRMQLRESLDLAMEVQQSLLPKGSPTFPGFDIEGRSVYCDETGGDYYDFLMLDRAHDTRLAIAMGDVTGHGIAAALLMTTARALVRSRAGVPGSLAQHITQINALLSADNDHGRFLTLFLLIMDRDRGDIRYVAAGHDPAVIYNPTTDSFRELDGEGGIPLGIDGTWEYHEHAAPIITSGEVMFVGTDGIWEARNAQDKLFGKDRMKEVIRAHAGGTCKDLCDAMLEAVQAYRGAVPQLDDITMVAVKAV